MKISLIKLFCEDARCPLKPRSDFTPCEAARETEKQKLDILFVGEGPGEEEVERGRPFIGRSGTLLRRAIRFAKTQPLNIGFSNVVRCLPLDKDNNIRRPTPEETQHCRHFLNRDIEQTDPDVIVALGNSAINTLLDGEFSISTEHGNYRRMNIMGRERIVFPTWHPAYIGRNKGYIPLFYEEIRQALKIATGWGPKPEWAKMGTSRLLKTVPEVEEYLEYLRRGLTKEDVVALDVETKNLCKRYGNKIGLIQFATDPDNATCIPLDHPETPFDAGEIEIVKALLRRLFTKKVSFGAWVCHSGKFEQMLIGEHILKQNNINRTFKNVPMLDTLGLAYILNENKVELGGEKAYRLKLLARQYLQFHHYDDETLQARSEGGLWNLPLECPIAAGEPGWYPNLTDYGGMDGYVTLRLLEALKDEAVDQKYLKKAMGLMTHLFSPTFRLLSAIERNGFWANLSHLHMLRDPERSPIFTRLDEIDKKLVREFESAQAVNKRLAVKTSGGHEPLFGDTPWVLDLNKNEHVREWLVNECKYEAPTKTDKGIPSVGKKYFQEYEGHPEIDLVAERRGLAKLASSYINQLIGYIDPTHQKDDAISSDSRDGRIRANIHFTSTVSGRASATKPNIHQQVRSDSPEKAAIKSIFQAEQPGVQSSFKIDFRKGQTEAKKAYEPKQAENCLVQLDFMTSEVRWWAILSKCPDLAKAFNNGKALRDAFRANPDDDVLRAKADIEGDVHKQTASLMYGVPVSEVDKIMRTAAKCLVGGTMLFTDEGVLPIEDLLGETTLKIGTADGTRIATRFWKTKIDSTTYVETNSGYSIQGTHDHRVQVLRPDLSIVWKQLSKLTPKDYLVIGTNNNVWPKRQFKIPAFNYNRLYPTDHCHTRLQRTSKTPATVNKYLARLLGYIVSEGNVKDSAIYFSNSDKSVLNDFLLCYEKCFGSRDGLSVNYNFKGDGVDTIFIGAYVTRFLRQLGIEAVLSAKKTIPDCIMRSPKRIVKEFLRAYFEGDGSSVFGCVNDVVKASSKSKKLIKQLHMVLLNFGIVGRISKERNSCPSFKKGEKRTYWVLYMSGENFDFFHDEIGFVSARKNKRPPKRNRYRAKIPYAKSLLHKGRGHYFGSWTGAKTTTYGYLDRNPSIVLDLRKADHIDLANNVAKIKNNRYFFDPVRIKRKTKKRVPVYDVFVPAGHKFLANGISAHNSIVFGWMFGRGTPAIAAQIHKSVDETEELVRQFGNKFPLGRDYLHNLPNVAKRTWFVESPIGRRRRLPGYMLDTGNWDKMFKDDRRLIGQCNRMAMNSPIQGISSDGAFIGTSLLLDHVEDHNKESWLIQNVVHDSCVYQVPIAELEESLTVAEEIFTTKTMNYMTEHWGVEFNCPIEVDFEVGLTWGELMKWDYTKKSLEKITESLLS